MGKAIGNRGLPGVGWSGLSSRPRSIMSCGRNTRDEDRRQCTGQASLPFHGNPLPLNGMGFYPALWQEFGNFRSLSDHSRAALRRRGTGGLLSCGVDTLDLWQRRPILHIAS